MNSHPFVCLSVLVYSFLLCEFCKSLHVWSYQLLSLDGTTTTKKNVIAVPEMFTLCLRVGTCSGGAISALGVQNNSIELSAPLLVAALKRLI